MSLLDTLKRTGFTFSEDATYSGKDDTGGISRVKVGGTLSINDVDQPKAIIKAIAANTGGQLSVNGVSDKVSGETACQLANELLGNPLSQDDAFDIAIGQAGHEETREQVRLDNDEQYAKRERLIEESEQRAADEALADSHVGEDAVAN